MKFRAVIHDQQHMKEFYGIVQTLSKLTKECVTNIMSDRIIFITNEESTSSAPLVWLEISAQTYFNEYTTVGVDEEHPNIVLAFNPFNLARALSALRNPVEFIKIKLTNKQFPCLTIQIDLPSHNSIQNRKIVHDVPVNIIPRREWNYYQVPKSPDTEIILTMPSLKFIRNLIDKIKNLSPQITLYATSAGELCIIAETDMATVNSYYRNLEVRKIDKERLQQHEQNSLNDAHDDDDVGDGVRVVGGRTKKDLEASCLIDCKKAAIFLTALPLFNMELSCGLIHNQVVQMQVEIRNGVIINCTIPAVCDD